ncbi:MAG: T9SS type A sorting domain-containing protein, partial [Bacteroidota bacterium]
VNMDTSWKVVNGPVWPESTPLSQVNYRFVDANGDGQINRSDLSVILHNYGQSHAGIALPNNLIDPRNQQNATLSIEIDSLIAGSITRLPIQLGSEENPVSNVYGIGFSISYDVPFFEANSLILDLSNSWLAQEATDLIAIAKVLPNDRRIDLAISRIDGQDIQGFGELAQLQLKALDQISSSNTTQQITLDLVNIRIQDVMENPFSVNPIASVVEVLKPTSLRTLPESSFTIYPIPAKQTIQLSASNDFQVKFIQIIDQQGRILDRLSSLDLNVRQSIDISSYTNGTYFVQIYTKEGFLTKKFLVKRNE